MEWTVARATQHTTPAGEAEGRHPRRDCAGRRGHHWESGEGKRRFVAWSFFTVMSVRRSSSFLVRVSSTSHSSDDG